MTCIISRLANVNVISDKVILQCHWTEVSMACNRALYPEPFYMNVYPRCKYIRYSWDETSSFLKDMVDMSQVYVKIDVPNFTSRVNSFFKTQEELGRIIPITLDTLNM